MDNLETIAITEVPKDKTAVFEGGDVKANAGTLYLVGALLGVVALRYAYKGLKRYCSEMLEIFKIVEEEKKNYLL